MARVQIQEQVSLPVRQSGTERGSKRLALWILIFAILTPAFVIGPALMGRTFPPYPLMDIADVFDLFTPLVLIPIYWLLFLWVGKGSPSLPESLVFMLLAAFWVEGQAMHLAANSIGHLVGEVSASDAAKLTYFYDEQLGHYLWHFGLLGLAALLIYREWRQPAGLLAHWGTSLLSSVIYGFTLFAAILEGQTTPMGLPFALVVAFVILVWGRRKLEGYPIRLFFLASFLVAVLFFAGWGLYWGGFPEFSEVGIIK
jgi:hypothetical protein